MKDKKLTIIVGVLFTTLMFVLPSLWVSAQTTIADDPKVPEIHVTRDGKAVVHGLKVLQRANTSLFVRMDWEDGYYMRWTVKTSATTDIRKRFGDKMLVSDIKEGDYIYVEGSIESGTSLSINAKKIIDWSEMTAQSSFSGKVKSISIPSRQFTLARDNGQIAEVFLNATTTVYRNKREISPKFIQIGDIVSSIEGIYDHAASTLLAQKIKIQLDPTLFQPQNYQGVLQSIPSGKPVTFVLRINGKDYTVVLSDNPLILNTARQTITFERFLVGDIVRLYGNIREDNDLLDTINASVVRNTTF